MAYWYQLKPVKAMPAFPNREARMAGIVAPPAPKPVKAEPKKKPAVATFKPLFDGKSFDGLSIYKHDGTKVAPADSAWSIADGVLHCTGDESKDYWVAADAKYGNVVLKMDYKVAPGANSGIFLRVPGHDRPAYTGFEVQVVDDSDGRVDKCMSGSIYDIFAPTANMSRPIGEWNHVEVTMRGLSCTVMLNGLKVLDANFAHLTELVGKFDFPYAKMAMTGYVGIQNHGNGTWWKNIQIKKLP